MNFSQFIRISTISYTERQKPWIFSPSNDRAGRYASPVLVQTAGSTAPDDANEFSDGWRPCGFVSAVRWG